MNRDLVHSYSIYYYLDGGLKSIHLLTSASNKTPRDVVAVLFAK